MDIKLAPSRNYYKEAQINKTQRAAPIGADQSACILFIKPDIVRMIARVHLLVVVRYTHLS